MMKLGITEKDCCQDLGPEFINNINNKFSSNLGNCGICFSIYGNPEYSHE